MKLTLILLLMLCISSINNAIAETYQNPVLPGFHPDPSITRVGNDYYLVNSSFEWYPGVPIFHSTDLVKWQQIGHVLNRPSQLNMINNRSSSGVWAPTIRHHNGKYYVIVTCKQCGNNFYVVSDQPEGPYSDPIYLKTPKGIDPSLFFDDDGKVWFSANRFPKEPDYKSQHIIYTQQVDLNKGVLFGPRYDLTDGKDCGVVATEGPHHYKIDDTYYLITAEGMTWNNHAVCVYSAPTPHGPFKLLENNPALTHRDKPELPIQHTGHADLVQTQFGDWWALVLGVRKIDGHYYLGRETFLTPVKWRHGTPVFNPESEQLTLTGTAPKLPTNKIRAIPDVDNFAHIQLALHWNFLRTPQTNWWSLFHRKGWLEIELRPNTLTQPTNPSLIARRFQHFDFIAATEIDFTPKVDGEEAGIAAVQNDRFQYRLVIKQTDSKQVLQLIKVFHKDRKVKQEVIVKQKPYEGEKVLAFEVHGLDIQFKIGTSKTSLKNFADVQDASILSSTRSGGFTGAFTGMYASSNGKISDNKAYFNWFEYRPLSKP
ncbi:glycoside hydrolase family 43 protein [Echinimonas agarilytica]|uniref:Glycoside hydrolase family 43 protein n=1 Tax=Echinimonas agarilytica TaxID=1215918 RepID=A0AA41W758_9GAMM|nr:glycoside hydrolase family 43 protein [Echinimonas agarilytica]MCM2679881.1 glycoside hydrolase family 43 protein [Echinimonas agarilytica]